YERVHQKYVDNFGGGVTHDNKMVQKMLLNLLMSKEYTFLDCIRFLQGQFFSLKHLQAEMQKVNLIETIDCVNVPIYFLMGKLDLMAPFEPTEKFYSKIEAPEKHWMMFDKSAHSPIWEEHDNFMEILL